LQTVVEVPELVFDGSVGGGRSIGNVAQCFCQRCLVMLLLVCAGLLLGLLVRLILWYAVDLFS